MLVAAAFARRHRSEGWACSLVLVLVVAVVLSLGPFLLVGGRPVIPLPGLAIGALPLIGKALPGRLMLYAFLALAMITALWLSRDVVPRWARVVTALAVIASTLPDPSPPRFWTSTIEVPRFFGDALDGGILGPRRDRGDTTLRHQRRQYGLATPKRLVLQNGRRLLLATRRLSSVSGR